MTPEWSSHCHYTNSLTGTIAIAYGVVSDIATPAERGSFVGAVLCGYQSKSPLIAHSLTSKRSPNVAPSLGPILGGALAQHPGWPWIFWLLAVLSGFCLVVLFVFLPETARTIVGSGGYPATVPGLDICSKSGRQKHFPQRTDNSSLIGRLRLPNPLKCLVLLAKKENTLVIMINAICYTTYCCVQASLALLFIEIYHFKDIQAGLVYLPFGCGCVIASLVSGDNLSRGNRSL